MAHFNDSVYRARQASGKNSIRGYIKKPFCHNYTDSPSSSSSLLNRSAPTAPAEPLSHPRFIDIIQTVADMVLGHQHALLEDSHIVLVRRYPALPDVLR